jgi:hypothetical protein
MRKLGVSLIILIVIAVIGVVSLWYALAVIYNLPNPSPTPYNATYTSLLIKNLDPNSKIVFGDTEYFFGYSGNAQPRYLWIDATLESPVKLYPEIGHSYETVGIEINVVNMSSKDISVMIRPTVENYMFSTYHYTRIEIPCEQGAQADQNATVTVSLAGSANKTRQYTFEYPFAPSATPGSMFNVTFIVKDSSQSKQYEAAVGFDVTQAKNDFNIQFSIYQAFSNYMVIYVRPLY